MTTVTAMSRLEAATDPPARRLGPANRAVRGGSKRVIFPVNERRSICIAAACALSVAASACGSSSTTTVVKSSSSSTTTIAAAQPAAITAPSSAPEYCRTLTADPAVRGLGAAIAQLARTPNDASAHSTLRAAAAAMNSAASHAPDGARQALQTAATAVLAVDRRGLQAAPAFNSTLQTAGRTLEMTCAFPVG